MATDVAGRGLDVKDVQFVINYDMAKNIEGGSSVVNACAFPGCMLGAAAFADWHRLALIHQYSDVENLRGHAFSLPHADYTHRVVRARRALPSRSSPRATRRCSTTSSRCSRRVQVRERMLVLPLVLAVLGVCVCVILVVVVCVCAAEIASFSTVRTRGNGGFGRNV